jgi:hypothetical protein
MLRDAVEEHPLLHRYLRFLTTPDLIPEQFRPSGIDQPCGPGWREWRSHGKTMNSCSTPPGRRCTSGQPVSTETPSSTGT